MIKHIDDYHALMDAREQAKYAEFEAYSELFEFADTVNWKSWREPRVLCFQRSLEEAVDAFIAMRGFVRDKSIKPHPFGIDRLFRSHARLLQKGNVYGFLKRAFNNLKNYRNIDFYLCQILKILMLSFPEISQENIFKEFERQFSETIQNNREKRILRKPEKA
jgi:hypothetical protein